MTRYRCFNTPSQTRDVIEASASHHNVRTDRTENGELLLGSPVGGYFAKAIMSFEPYGDGGCEIELYVRPRAWLLALIHLVIIGLCGVLFWLISDKPVTNFFFVLIAMAAVGFSVFLLVVGTRCSNRLERIFTAAGKKKLSGLNQVSPFAVQIRWYEFVALGFWPMLVVIYVSMKWGVTGAIFSQIILVAALYGIPMVQRAQSSYRISQYLLEMNLVIACAVFIAAFTVMASGGSTYSFIENYEGDRKQINASILFNNMIQSEWNRDDVVGLRGEEYAQALAGLMSTKPQAMMMTKVTVAFMAFFAILGFWAMRRSSGLGKSLVQVGRPETPDMPMPPTDEHVGRLVYLTMLVGCVLAGIYRWVYALLCVDVTLAIWFQKSYIYAPIDWLVVFYLEMLDANERHSTLWHIAGVGILQLIAIPGLLMVSVSLFYLLRMLYRDVISSWRCKRTQWNHPAVEEFRLIIRDHKNHRHIQVIAGSRLQSVAVARMSLFTRRRMIVVDVDQVSGMNDEPVIASLLHELGHLDKHTHFLTLMELISLLLLAPNNTFQVLHDFHRAEFEADAYCYEIMREQDALISAIVWSDLSRNHTNGDGKGEAACHFMSLSKFKCLYSWMAPIFVRNAIWTAAYPTSRVRVRRRKRITTDEVMS